MRSRACVRQNMDIRMKNHLKILSISIWFPSTSENNSTKYIYMYVLHLDILLYTHIRSHSCSHTPNIYIRKIWYQLERHQSDAMNIGSDEAKYENISQESLAGCPCIKKRQVHYILRNIHANYFLESIYENGKWCLCVTLVPYIILNVKTKYIKYIRFRSLTHTEFNFMAEFISGLALLKAIWEYENEC